MASPVQYDFTKTKLIVAGVPMVAFADGEGWSIEYDNDQNSKHVGVDGIGRIIRNNDRSATLTIRLADYSPSNLALSALDIAGIPFPFGGVDLTSNADIAGAKQCAILKVPALAKGDTSTMNEWTITCVSAVIAHTGAKKSPL